MAVEMVLLTDVFGKIGNEENGLVYKFKEDMDYFKERTRNSVLIMGRKTYESLPNAQSLVKRDNYIVVLTESKEEGTVLENGVITINSISSPLLINLYQRYGNIIVLGGSSLFSWSFLNNLQEELGASSINVYINFVKQFLSLSGGVFVDLREFEEANFDKLELIKETDSVLYYRWSKELK